jgi:fermentation-respiration switch protein FrsA (DUF1100 family)
VAPYCPTVPMKRYWKRIAGAVRTHWFSVVLLIFVLGFIMTPHRLERMFIYFPTRQILENPGSVGLRYRDIRLVTADHVRIHGWFLPCEGAAGTILVFHGNGGNIGDRVEWLRMLHELGLHILIIDYRGYGKSEGEPFEKGLYRDAHAAYAWWTKERKPRGDRLILLGESLGGAVAVHLAADAAPAALILQSTFTSARDMARTLFPIGLLRPLAGVHYDSAGIIGRISCPKLVIHGSRDEIVPFELGKSLFDLAPPPKSFYAVPGAGHNDLPWVAGAEYLLRMKEFLSGIAGPAPSAGQ